MTSRRVFLSGGAVFAATLATAPRLLADGGAPTINFGKKTKKSNTGSKPSADCKTMATQLKGFDRKLNTLSNNRKSAIRRLISANDKVDDSDDRINFWRKQVKDLQRFEKELKRDKKRGYTIIKGARFDINLDDFIKEEKSVARNISKAQTSLERETDNWVRLKSQASDRKQKVKDIEDDIKDIAGQKRAMERAYNRAKCS